MIVAVVQFKLPEGMAADEAARLFEASRPRYEGLTGLLRKHYLLGDGVGGGAYLWESRAAADALYESDAWRDGIRERFGSDPSVQYFDVPVTVDNTA